MSEERIDPETGELQQPLPGEWPQFPPPPPFISEIQTFTGPQPVQAVSLSFSGSRNLVATSPEDVLMAQQAVPDGRLWLHAEVEVVKTSIASTKSGVVGQASAQIVQAIRADEEGSLHLYAELERTRQALHRLRYAAMGLHQRFDETARPYLPAVDDDDDSPAAHGIRALLSAAMSVRFAVSATQWVPHPKPEDD